MIQPKSNRWPAVGLIIVFASGTLFATTVTIDFAGLSDGTFVSTQYPGVTFSNAQILSAGVSLDNSDFPPFTGLNVVSDFDGPISLVFTDPALTFLGRFTYATPLSIEAFDLSNNLLASVSSMYSSNSVFGGEVGSAPNEPIQISSTTGISRLVIEGDSAGNSFTIGAATFTTAEDSTVPEPSSASSALIALCFLFFAMIVRGRHSLTFAGKTRQIHRKSPREGLSSPQQERSH